MSLYADPRFQAFMGQVWRPGGESLTRHGAELCMWVPGALLADVGCGPGGTSALLREDGYRVLSVDRQLDARCPGAVVADACALPLADNALDGLVCECVLSLVPEPAEVLREFARVLKPGARALISDLTTVQQQAQILSCKGSCADGALNPDRMAEWFTCAGLCLMHMEDHSRVLRELAAQLVWHGIACGTPGSARLGYHLWIVEKGVV